MYDSSIEVVDPLTPLKTPMEYHEETEGPGLLELERFAAASVAYLTSSSGELHGQTFCSCVERQEGAETHSFLEESSGDTDQLLARLVTHAKAFQFFFALQEAEQRLEDVKHDRNGTATDLQTTELEKTARGAVAAAIQTYVSHSADDASSSATQRTTTAAACRPGLTATADVEDSYLSSNPAAPGGGGDVHELPQEDVPLVSDTEIEAWKWEALSADSETPTDTEGQAFVQGGNRTSLNETCSYRGSGVENLSVTSGQEGAGQTELSQKQGGTPTRQRAEVAQADQTDAGTLEEDFTLPSKREVHSASVEAEAINQVATSRASKVHLVDQNHGAADPALAEGHTVCHTRRPSKVAIRFHAEAAERQYLFSFPARGVRRRRGRREHKLSGSDSVPGNATREPVIEEDKDDDVTGQLLGLAQEMKVEATRYGEALQRDNERLKRTGEAQQQYVDETEASARQTRSFIKGTGFGFLYAVILLIVTCSLFVSMVAFIIFVRG